MQIFKVLSSIETKKLEGPDVQSVISDQNVYIIVDEKNKDLFLFPTKNAPLRLKIIGQRLIKEIKRSMHGLYHIIDNISDEQRDGLKTSLIDDGPVKELYNPNLYQAKENTGTSNLQNKIPIFQKFPWWLDLNFSSLDVFSPKVQKHPEIDLETFEISEKNHPNLVLIGNKCFSFGTELSQFVEKREINVHSHFLGTLPDGWVFLKDYQPRIAVSHGKISSIALYHKNSDKNREIVDIPTTPLPFPRISVERNVQEMIDVFHIPVSRPFTEVFQEYQEKTQNSNIDPFSNNDED